MVRVSFLSEHRLGRDVAFTLRMMGETTLPVVGRVSGCSLEEFIKVGHWMKDGLAEEPRVGVYSPEMWSLIPQGVMSKCLRFECTGGC